MTRRDYCVECGEMIGDCDAHEITEETNIRLERNITMLRTRRDCC